MANQNRVNFTYLDSDGLYEELGISKEVYRTTERWQQSKDSLPRRLQEDEGEQLVQRQCFDAVASWEEQFRGPETDRAKDRDSIYPDVHSPMAAVSQAETDLADIVREFRDTQEALQTDLGREKDALLNIKQLHGLSRDPVYETNRKPVYVLTAIAGLVETAVGTSSLAAVSLGGLLGGASLSLIMSTLNLGIAIILGLYAPRLYEPRRNRLAKRVAGVSLVLLSLLIVLMANLMFGNVRHFGLETFSTSLSLFWQGRILPQSLESFGLVAFGIMIFGGAFLKYSRLRDSVPEYERAGRRVAEIEREIANLRSQVRPALRRVVDAANQRLSDLTDEARDASIACRHSLRDTEDAYQSYVMGRARIIKVHEQCAEKRRSALKYACQQVPDYWKESAIDFSGITGSGWDLSSAQTRLVSVEALASELLSNIAEARSNLELTYRRILESHQELSKDENSEIAEAA